MWCHHLTLFAADTTFNTARMKPNEIQLLFAFTCLGLVNATDQGSPEWSGLVFKEGTTAYLPCPPHGHANAFFWRKGEWFNESENIASIVHGIADTSEKYDVLFDGTLVIMDISSDDEGKYYCRIASETNECHGSITLYLEVSAEALDIAIEGCTSSSRCIKFVEPSLEIKLTCTVNIISELMTLKWYNGSKEIIGNVHVSETFGKKVKMINVIKFMSGDEAHFTCEAEGLNLAKSMAVIQLKQKEVSIPVEHEATMTLLVPTIVLGIICLVLTGILIGLIARDRKPNKEQSKEVNESHILKVSPEVTKQVDEKEDEEKGEKHPLFISKEGKDADFGTPETEQKTQPEEIKTKDEALSAKEETIKNLQKDLLEANTKLSVAEDEKKDLQRTLQDMKKNLTSAETTEKVSFQVIRKNLTESKQKLTVSENEKKNLEEDLRGANLKLSSCKTTIKNLEEELRGANDKLSSCKTTIKELQRDLQEECTKLSKSEDTNQLFITKIIEMKDTVLRSQPESIPTVIIGVKGVFSIGVPSCEDVMPKPKYGNVSLVTGPSYQKNIFEKIKDKVKTCFSGKDTYIFVFGREESNLHHTLHGEQKNKGLIEMVAHQLFVSSNHLKENGFQVNINVSIANIALSDKVQRFRSPSVQAEGTDKVNLENGVEISLNKHSVQSEQSLLKIVSFMTPNEVNLRSHGLLKVTVESFVGKTTVSKGTIFIASVINLMKIPKVFNRNLNDNLEYVLALLTKNSKGDFVLIPNLNPGAENEPRKTFEAVKKALDAYR